MLQKKSCYLYYIYIYIYIFISYIEIVQKLVYQGAHSEGYSVPVSALMEMSFEHDFSISV